MPSDDARPRKRGWGGGAACCGGGGRRAVRTWMLRAALSVLVWTAVMQLWPHYGHPQLPCVYPRAGDAAAAAAAAVSGADKSPFSPPTPLPRRIYRNNGYLRISCNGGLNQMRAAICDMVTVARYLNLTLVVPELDKRSFWADTSDFGDIFSVKHFINSLRDEVKIIEALPQKFSRKNRNSPLSMPPVSWSNENYYLKQILPLVRKHKVIHFNKTDARLANNGLPVELQKLRCRVNYESLQFTPQIQSIGDKLISILRRNGPFLVLHLRYEMDMLAFSGCTHGCSSEETEELTRMRYAYPWWKEKEIDSEMKRLEGLCPLTPEETALVLKALDFPRSQQIYIASGETYGGERRMSALRKAYPKTVRKEMLLSADELKPFLNHSSQMAALDYLVSIASDVFVPSYDGNMAKVVEGHRRYMGFRTTILLDRRQLVELLDLYQNGKMSWDQFSVAVQELHQNRLGQPTLRTVIPGRPKEEDYFYANPQECLQIPSSQSTESRDSDI